MNGGLSARGLRLAYERGRKAVRQITQNRLREMKARVGAELDHRQASRKNWKGSR
jgi:hypothetical protein